MEDIDCRYTPRFEPMTVKVDYKTACRFTFAEEYRRYMTAKQAAEQSGNWAEVFRLKRNMHTTYGKSARAIISDDVGEWGAPCPPLPEPKAVIAMSDDQLYGKATRNADGSPVHNGPSRPTGERITYAVDDFAETNRRLKALEGNKLDEVFDGHSVNADAMLLNYDEKWRDRWELPPYHATHCFECSRPITDTRYVCDDCTSDETATSKARVRYYAAVAYKMRAPIVPPDIDCRP